MGFSRRLLIGLTGATILLMGASLSLAATLKVTPTGKGRASLLGAVAAAQAGDTILMEPGLYRTTKDIRFGRSGEKGKPITVRASQAGKVQLIWSSTYGFLLERVSHIVIQGLIMDSPRGCGVKLRNARECVLRNLKISSTRSHLISVQGGGNHRIENCELFNSKSCGIALEADKETGRGGGGNTVVGNHSHHNGDQGLLVLTKKNLIKKNRSHDNGRAQDYPLDHGIYILGAYNKVIGNRSYNNKYGSGIRVGGPYHHLKNNICWENGSVGMVIAGTNDSRDLTIEHNRFKDNVHSGLQVNAAKYKPVKILIRANEIIGNETNLWLQAGVSRVEVEYNVFAGAKKHQIRLENKPGATILLKNRFYGPCSFYLGQKTVPGRVFFKLYQAQAKCADKPYKR